MTERTDALRAMVRDDPADLLARYLLGKACLDERLFDEALEHLEHYCDRYDGDRGAAYGALAEALEAKGRLHDAVDALDRGIANARAHRHLQLEATLQEERTRLGEGSGARP